MQEDSLLRINRLKMEETFRFNRYVDRILNCIQRWRIEERNDKHRSINQILLQHFQDYFTKVAGK